MSESDTDAAKSASSTMLSNCPQCAADLAVLRVIGGKDGSEYWTLRCTRCGGVYLNIVKASPPAQPA
jgi:uncharacterized Zn finger protein